MRPLLIICALLQLLFFNASKAQSNESDYVIIETDTFYINPDSSGIYSHATKGSITIYSYVEQMPIPGYDINSFVARNKKYPKELKESERTGRVLVTFIITDKGEITTPKISNKTTAHPLLQEEAVRIVKSLPKWKPGKQNGKPVFVNYLLPIHF